MTGSNLPPVREYQVPDSLVVKMVPPRLWMKRQGVKPGDWLDIFERADGVLEVRKRNGKAA